MEKTCKGCGLQKPLDDFYANINTKDGRLNWCKPCFIARHREKKNARATALRAEIQAIKLKRGCSDCGYNAHAEALDFDHLPGFQKLHRMASASGGLSRVVLEAEIAKCEVVCANCHRVRTASRRNGHVSSQESEESQTGSASPLSPVGS